MLAITLLPALLVTLSMAAPATFFNIFGLNAYDEHRPSTEHVISFQVSNPNAVWEQGGSEVANCSIKWYEGDAPTCWTACSTNGPAWYTRLTPGYDPYGYYYGNFSLDIAEYFVYKAPVLNNVSIIAEVGWDGYTCSNGAQSSICGIWEGNGLDFGINGTFESYYGPDVDVICQSDK